MFLRDSASQRSCELRRMPIDMSRAIACCCASNMVESMCTEYVIIIIVFTLRTSVRWCGADRKKIYRAPRLYIYHMFPSARGTQHNNMFATMVFWLWHPHICDEGITDVVSAPNHGRQQFEMVDGNVQTWVSLLAPDCVESVGITGDRRAKKWKRAVTNMTIIRFIRDTNQERKTSRWESTHTHTYKHTQKSINVCKSTVLWWNSAVVNKSNIYTLGVMENVWVLVYKYL